MKDQEGQDDGAKSPPKVQTLKGRTLSGQPAVSGEAVRLSNGVKMAAHITISRPANMAKSGQEQDDRTTPLGFYHFARSYKAAYKILAREMTRKHATHPYAPQEFLLIHAIELYLKSYLRLQGYSVRRLKDRIGHDFPVLAKHFSEKGGFLDDEDWEVINLLTPENVFGVRYIVIGPARRATTDALDRTANSLHKTVRDALRNVGVMCAA